MQIVNSNGYSAGPFHEERECLIMAIQRGNLDMFKVLCANLRNFEPNVVILNELVRLNEVEMMKFLLFDYANAMSSAAIKKEVIESLERNNCRGKGKEEMRNLLRKWSDDQEAKENASSSSSSSSETSSSSSDDDDDDTALSEDKSPSVSKARAEDDDEEEENDKRKKKKPAPKAKKPAPKAKKVAAKKAASVPRGKKEASKSLPKVKSEPRD